MNMVVYVGTVYLCINSPTVYIYCTVYKTFCTIITVSL